MSNISARFRASRSWRLLSRRSLRFRPRTISCTTPRSKWSRASKSRRTATRSDYASISLKIERARPWTRRSAFDLGDLRSLDAHAGHQSLLIENEGIGVVLQRGCGKAFRNPFIDEYQGRKSHIDNYVRARVLLLSL